MAKAPAEPLRLHGPPLLFGSPRRVTGHVEVENTGADELQLTSIEVVDGDLCHRGGREVGEVPVLCSLPPGRRTRVPVRLRLDRTTPPGRHEVALVVGGVRTSAVVEVAPQPRARVWPATVLLEGAPGAAVAAPIVVANLGNVPIALDRLVGVRIEERDAMCRSLEAALRTAGDRGHEAFLDEVVREVARTRVGFLRLAVDDATPVAPGETRRVTLTCRLPDDLRPRRAYAGTLDLPGVSVAFAVTADGAPAADRDAS